MKFRKRNNKILNAKAYIVIKNYSKINIKQMVVNIPFFKFKFHFNFTFKQLCT